MLVCQFHHRHHHHDRHHHDRDRDHYDHHDHRQHHHCRYDDHDHHASHHEMRLTGADTDSLSSFLMTMKGLQKFNTFSDFDCAH